MESKNLKRMLYVARLSHSLKAANIPESLFSIRLVLISVLLLASVSMAQNILMTDDLGHRLELKGCPQRIISLAPNLTEILFALELDREIIGVTRFCDFPPQARTKEIIGGLVDPSLEKIQVLHPDLILGFRGNPRRVVEKIYEEKLPVLVFQSGKSFDDLFLLIKRIGKLTCREVQAEALCLEMRKRLQAVDSRLSQIKPEKKVFLTLYGQGPGLWTCGRDSYLSNLLLRAKVRNVASSLRGNWLVYNREKLIQDNPEIILILGGDEGAFENSKKWFLSEPTFRKIAAVSEKNFIFLDENLFSRFGPRLVQAYEQLAGAVHPELFLEEK